MGGLTLVRAAHNLRLLLPSGRLRNQIVAALGAPRVPVRRGVALPCRSAYVPIRLRDCRGRCQGSLDFGARWALLRVGGDRLGRPL